MIPGGLISTLLTNSSSGGFSVVAGIPLDLKFNGADGSSTIVNDGTYTGSVTANATLNAANAAVGSACLAPGSSLVYPADASLTLSSANFTIEFWVLLTSRGMFSSCPVSGTGWNINLGNSLYNQSSWLSYDNQWASHWGGNGPGWGELPLYTWKYVTLTRQGSELYTHLDGVYVGSADIGANTTLTGENAIDGINIGFNEGYIDNFKLTIGTAVYSKGVDFSIPTVNASTRFSSVPASINEGSAGTFTVYPQGMASGTTLYWTINNIGTTDADFSEISGSFDYTGTAASFTVTPLADSVTEGNETFTVSIRTGSVTGPVILTSTPTTVVDSSQAISYAFTSAPTSINEGVATTYTVGTNAIANGTVLYWKIVNSSTSSADFSASSGSFTINSNTGTFDITTVADVANEGSELFAVEIRTGSLTGPVVLTSEPITVNDTSVAKSYVLTAPATINEGSAGSFSVTTTGVTNGTVLYWRVNTLTTANADFSAITGTVTINNNAGTFTVTPVTDTNIEGNKTFTVSLKTSSSTSATILVTSDVVTVVDTTVPPTATFTNLPATINEANTQITFTTAGFAGGTGTVYWTIDHITTSAADFSPVSGFIGVNNNRGSFYLNVVADKLTEGTETFTISLRTGSTTGTVIATSDVISITDTSIKPTYLITPATSTINEGTATTMTVTTAGVANNTRLFWTIETNAGDFSTTSGYVTINNNTGTFTVTPTADFTTEGAETFTVAIRLNSVTGAIVYTSDPITINDTSLTPVFTFSSSPSTISKGNTGVFNVVSSTIPTATLYWSIVNGTTTDTDFTEVSGTFYIVNNAGSFGVDIPRSVATDTLKTFTINIKSGSQSGQLENTSSTIAITQDPLVNPADPPNANVSLLLHGNDINGATTYYDSSYTSKLVTRQSTFNSISTAQSKFGGSSILLSPNYSIANYLYITSTTDTNAVGSGDFTVEAWAFTPATRPEAGIVAAISGSGTTVTSNGYKLVQVGSAWSAVAYSGSTTFTITGGTVTLNTWQHVAMSRSGNLLRLFVDGLVVGKVWLINPTTKAGSVLNTATNFYVGSSNNLTTTNFSGYLDDVRVTKGTGIYTADFNVPTSQLTDPRSIGYGRGYRVAGTVSGVSQSSTGYLKFPDETSVFDVTAAINLGQARQGLAGVNSNQRGYFGGGWVSGSTLSNRIDALQFSDQTLSTPASTLAVARQQVTGYNSSTRGYFVGGAAASAVLSNKIDGIQFDTEAAIAPTATLATAKQSMAGFNSSTSGYVAGGWTTARQAAIERMLFSTETNSAISATLGAGVRYPAGLNSSTKGYVGGGATDANTSGVNTITGLAFDTETSGTLSATLAVARRSAVGVNSTVKGYFLCGTYSSANGEVDGIQFDTEAAINPSAVLNSAYDAASCQSNSL